MFGVVLAEAQTRTPYMSPKVQFFDRNGKPLASCRLYSYTAGTTTPRPTYSSATGAANTNPAICDGAGRLDIWLDASASYKFILKDRNDVQQWSVDNITDWGGYYATGSSAAAGDISGSLDALTVTKLQGISVSTTDPTAGQVLVFTGGAWTPGGVDLTTGVTGILPAGNGGTGNAFFTVAGPTTTPRNFTFPDASDTMATWGRVNQFTKALTVTPVDLTITAADGTVPVDGSLSNHFRLTLTTDCPCTMNTPTNLANGQKVLFEITQATGGSETLDWSAGFVWSSGVAKPTITVTASKKDFVTGVYNSTTAKIYMLHVTQGY